MIGPGLVWTCWQAADRVVLDDGTPPAEAPFRWLHLDLWDQRSARWIAQQSGLPADVQEAFLSTDDQPRVLGRSGALALVLPDFEREFDREETERIGALRVALRPGLVLTGRYHPLHTPDIFRHRAAQAETLDAPSALELICNSLTDTLGSRTGSVLSALLALEDKLLADQDPPDTRALVSLRRLTARLFRMAGGMHTTFIGAIEDPAIGTVYRDVLTRAERRMQPIERDTVAAQGQLRLLREELDLQAGQRTNEKRLPALNNHSVDHASDARHRLFRDEHRRHAVRTWQRRHPVGDNARRRLVAGHVADASKHGLDPAIAGNAG